LIYLRYSLEDLFGQLRAELRLHFLIYEGDQTILDVLLSLEKLLYNITEQIFKHGEV